jgi:hypothetical protein
MCPIINGSGNGNGGSSSAFEEIFGGDAVPVLADGTTATLKWAHGFGTHLLDFSDAAAPTLITASTIAVSVNVQADGAGAGNLTFALVIDADGNGGQQNGFMPVSALVQGGASLPFVCPAGGVVKVTAQQVGGDTDVNATLSATVQQV